MSHSLSLSGRQSLPPSREMKNAKALFLQPPVHGGHRIHDLTPVHQQHPLWPLRGERSESKKKPLWEQVAASDPEAVSSGQRRRAGLCSLLHGPGCSPASLAPACFLSQVLQLSSRVCVFPSIVSISASFADVTQIWFCSLQRQTPTGTVSSVYFTSR